MSGLPDRLPICKNDVLLPGDCAASAAVPKPAAEFCDFQNLGNTTVDSG